VATLRLEVGDNGSKNLATLAMLSRWCNFFQHHREIRPDGEKEGSL
jgi:hypothetical protein